MKRGFQLLIIVLICLFELSCSNSKTKNDEQKDNSPNVVQVNSSIPQKEVLASDIFSEFQFVKLENHPDAIFGSVDRIIFSKDRIYILDSFTTGSILSFDRSGRFCNSLNNKGKGPGEVMIPMDFYLDTISSTAYVLDMEMYLKSFKIINDKFEYKETNSLPGSMGSFKIAVIDSEKQAFIVGGGTSELAISNGSLNDISFYFPHSISKRTPVLREGLNYGYNNVLFRRFGNDTIYSISSGTPKASRIFLFDQPLTYNELFNLNESAFNSMLKKYYMINLYFETESNFYLKYSLDKEEMYVFGNTKGENIQVKKANLINDIFGTSNFICIGTDQYTGSYIFYTTPAHLLNVMQNSPEKLNKKSLKMISELNLGENDNYILIMLKMFGHE